MDAHGLVRDWNPAANRIFGYTFDEAVGRELAELIVPGPLRDAHRNALQRYLDTRESTILDGRVELSAVRSDGSEFPVELTVTQLADVDPPVFAGFIRDLSELAVAKRQNVRMQQRMVFLAQTGLVLDRSLDFDETLHRLADLTVPELAQLTVIDLLGDDQSIGAAVAAAPDPAHAREVEEMRRTHPLDLDSAHPVAGVLRSGVSALLGSMTADYQREIAQGAEHFELMRRLGYHSAIVVPLVARQRVLGTLSLLRMEDAGSFDQDDLVLAEELARRAALAIDNARLFEATRHLARTLQESLLPRALPEIPGVWITGRYRAAAQGQEVGGDFYDAFAIDEDRWGIAIGDVCGKGPQAAALTALARYTIRALSDREPGSVLRLLNDAVMRDRDLLPERFLTALYGVGSITPDGLTLDIAVAGHPAPLILRADGRVQRVPAAGPMIGITPVVEYLPQRLVLGVGDTLVLYTDGLTDARAPDQTLFEPDVVNLLRDGHGMEPDELLEFLEDSVTEGEDARDDIALLVVKRVDDPDSVAPPRARLPLEQTEPAPLPLTPVRLGGSLD